LISAKDTFIREYYAESACENSTAGNGKASTNGGTAQKEWSVWGHSKVVQLRK